MDRQGRYRFLQKFELLEKRYLPVVSLYDVGDSNHDGLNTNLDIQSSICNRANALANQPIANTAYAWADQPLFFNGPSYSDIQQGNLGDCYVLSSLSEVALKNSSIIFDMFQDNYDGTYNFKYYTNTQPYTQEGISHTIIIDAQLPSGYANYSSELWVALAEKAFAEIKGGDYNSLNSGSTLEMMSRITGNKWMLPFADIDEAIIAFNNGNFIGLETGLTPDNSAVTPRHSYALISHDDINQLMTLYNPHGFLQTFSYSDINNENNFRATVGVYND